jgi:hypothetical protein
MLGLNELRYLMRTGLIVPLFMMLPRIVFADEPPSPPPPTMSHNADGAAPTRDQEGADRALAIRLQNRLSGLLSIDLNLGISGFKHQPEVGTLFPIARLLLGYRKDFEPGWGYHLRAGPMLGMPWRRTSGDPGPDGVKVDTTILTGGSLEGLFVMGPFGRFFVGPVLCLDYVYMTNTTLHNVYPTVHLHNGVTAGGGFDLGAVVGSQEQFTVYGSLRMTAGVGESIISLLFGIGYTR